MNIHIHTYKNICPTGHRKFPKNRICFSDTHKKEKTTVLWQFCRDLNEGCRSPMSEGRGGGARPDTERQPVPVLLRMADSMDFYIFFKNNKNILI